MYRNSKRCTVRKVGFEHYCVSLRGAFKPRWLALLSTRLAELGLSIEKASAKRRADGQWRAEIDVRGTGSGLEIDKLPFLQMAEEEGSLEPSELAIRSYHLALSPEHGGSVRLEVEAPDALGLLARLLSTFVLAVLFPVELHIETRAGIAYDAFLLTSSGMSHPSESALTMLRTQLEKAIV